MVVRELRDDHGAGSGPRPSGRHRSRAARARASARPGARPAPAPASAGRRSRRRPPPRSGPGATASVIRPVSGQVTTRSDTIGNRASGPGGGGIATATQVRQRGLELGEVVASARGRAAAGSLRATMSAQATPARATAAPRAVAVRAPPVGDQQGHRRSGPSPRPGRGTGPSPPSRAPATSHHPAGRVARPARQPASATALDRAIRFGFQMNVDPSTAEVETASSEPGDQAGDRAGDRPREPPGHGDRGDPGQGDHGDHRQRRVATGQEGRRARGGSSRGPRGGRRRSTSAARAAARRRPGPRPAGRACRGPGPVPRSAGREVRRRRSGRERDRPSGTRTMRAVQATRRVAARTGRRDPSPARRHSAGSGARGAVRARLPRTVNASGGSVGERSTGREVRRRERC